MYLLFIVLLASTHLLIGCGGGGPGVPPTAPTINSVAPTGEIGFATDAITFSADIDGSVTAYQWTFDGGFSLPTSDVAAPTGTLDIAGSFGGTLVACNDAGCSEVFPFSYTSLPADPPTVTGIFPQQDVLTRAEWVEFRAATTGAPGTWHWTIINPDGSTHFEGNTSTPILPALRLWASGVFTIRVQPANRFGEGEVFTITQQVSPFTLVQTQGEFSAVALLGLEGKPLKVVEYGDLLAILWATQAGPRLVVSKTSTPMTATDFTLVPLPPAIPSFVDMVCIDDHLILLGIESTQDVVLAVASETVPTEPATWSTHQPGIRSDNAQLLAGEGGLAVVPRSNLLAAPDPIAVSSNRLPLSASDWRTGVFPEYLFSGPRGFRGVVLSDAVLLYRLRTAEFINIDELNPAQALESLTLPLATDPSELSNWLVGTIVEATTESRLGGWPFPHVSDDGVLTLPMSVGQDVRRFRLRGSRPTSPADWEMLPSSSEAGDVPDMGESTGRKPILTEDIAWTIDSLGRTAYAGRELRQFANGATRGVLTLTMLLPTPEGERLRSFRRLAYTGNCSGTEPFSPFTPVLLNLTCDQERVRTVNVMELAAGQCAPETTHFLQLSYLIWPASD